MSSEQLPTVNVEGRKVTWGYARKRNLGDYNSEEVSMFVSEHVPGSVENVMEFVADKTESAVDVIKAEVWASLGLAFSYDAGGKPHLDKPKPLDPRQQPAQPPPPQQQQQQAQPAGQPPPVDQPRGSGRGDQPSVSQVGYYAQFPGYCKDCGAQGVESFYDNRADVDDRIKAGKKIGPDFKCKNCGNGIFRPGSYDYNQAIKKGQTPGQAQPQQTLPPPV